MKMKWIGASLVLVMLAGGPLFADSVYFWTDENGVRHYSNTGIPPGVQEANERPEESPSAPSPEVNSATGNGSASGSSSDAWSGDTPEEEAAAADSTKKMDKRLAARVEKERARLGAEIKRIQNLSIGKSFTPGMKDAMVKPLEEQLALLNADPERYFRMKREGAFDNGSGGSAPPASGGPLANSLESFEGSSSSGQFSSGEANPPGGESENPPSE
jgi:hypothetical protein